MFKLLMRLALQRSYHVPEPIAHTYAAVTQDARVRVELTKKLYVLSITTAQIGFELVCPRVRRRIDAVEIVRGNPLFFQPFDEFPMQKVRPPTL